jgi:hypothetical protein
MTVRKIIEIIDFTKSKLGKGEFQTKLQDYQSTIENNSSNIVLLKELLDKSIDDLIDLKNEDIPNLLGKILVGNINPFAIENYKKKLYLLLNKHHTDYSILYNELHSLLNDMIHDLKYNLDELEKIKKIILPFQEKDFSELQSNDNSIFAIIFSNDKSIGNIKSLSYELKNWDKCLFLFQLIVSDKTPSPFEIIEVEQGSIEVIINLAYEISDKLLDVFNTGLDTYTAYLAYKTLVKDNITKTFNGNEELIELEEKKEKLMLQNVKDAIKRELKKKAKKDKEEALEKKIEEVTRLLTEHIVKGNTVKLLSAPKEFEEVMKKEKERSILYTKSQIDYIKLDKESKQFLIEHFTKSPPADDYEQ